MSRSQHGEAPQMCRNKVPTLPFTLTLLINSTSRSTAADSNNKKTPNKMPAPPRATLLILLVHGFKGHDVHTFLEFPSEIMALLTNSRPNLDVEAIVYPQYDTRGDFSVSVTKWEGGNSQQLSWYAPPLTRIIVSHNRPLSTILQCGLSSRSSHGKSSTFAHMVQEHGMRGYPPSMCASLATLWED